MSPALRYRAAGRAHLDDTRRALAALERELPHLEQWGRLVAATLSAGGRVLAAGNGGSAAHAQHLTSELVGRYDRDRPAYSAIALHAETSALTAITNDFGAHECFARQVRAHGREGDVLVALSTSGASPNVLAAVAAAHEVRVTALALTGPLPNPLAETAHDFVPVHASTTASVQEAHQVLVHLLCEAIERALDRSVAPTRALGGTGTERVVGHDG
jgi:D-sedoheptulose 7-phosphate isomerase